MEWDLSKYTNTFIFFLQEILAVINIMGRWQSQRHYLLWPCPRSIVFFKWWEPSMRNAMCLCVLALPQETPSSAWNAVTLSVFLSEIGTILWQFWDFSAKMLFLETWWDKSGMAIMSSHQLFSADLTKNLLNYINIFSLWKKQNEANISMCMLISTGP